MQLSSMQQLEDDQTRDWKKDLRRARLRLSVLAATATFGVLAFALVATRMAEIYAGHAASTPERISFLAGDRAGAALLLIELLSVTGIWLLLPSRLLARRLLSTLMCTTTLYNLGFCLCLALPIWAPGQHVVLKDAGLHAFSPALIAATLLASLCFGAVVFSYRRLPQFDYEEMKWVLGLFLPWALSSYLAFWLCQS